MDANNPLRRLGIVCFVIGLMAQAGRAQSAHVDHAGLKKLGWQLACQMSTFKDRTFSETVEFLHAQGFHHIELWPGQSLSPKKKDVKIGPEMSAADLDALLAKLKEVHLDVVSYGVVDLPGDFNGQEPLRKAMEFAKKLKAKNVVVHGALQNDAAQIADEFGINVAVLDNATNKLPDSKRVGVCLDLTKSGALGDERVIEVHLDATDSSAVLTQLKGQDFKGVCAVEIHDGQGKDLDEKFIQAVNTFSDEVTKLAR